jgi:hypothetical protein
MLPSKDFKLLVEKILDVPQDNRTKAAKNFWAKETSLFKKLYKKYSDDRFWKVFSLCPEYQPSFKIASFAFFLDRKNSYWIKFLNQKWKTFHWRPPVFKQKKFNKNINKHTPYDIKRKTLRNFFD